MESLHSFHDPSLEMKIQSLREDLKILIQENLHEKWIFSMYSMWNDIVDYIAAQFDSNPEDIHKEISHFFNRYSKRKSFPLLQRMSNQYHFTKEDLIHFQPFCGTPYQIFLDVLKIEEIESHMKSFDLNHQKSYQKLIDFYQNMEYEEDEKDF